MWTAYSVVVESKTINKSIWTSDKSAYVFQGLFQLLKGQ